MRFTDQLRYSVSSLREHRLRAGLSSLGIAIGVGAVILLASIGEGVRVFVSQEFQQFGTNVLQVTPGKTETFGLPGAMGGTTHKLTLEDAESLHRVHGVRHVVPLVVGQARVTAAGRGRSVFVFGVTSDASELWQVRTTQGSFLPDGDPRRGGPLVVLGPGLKRELLGERNAVGSWVRAGGRRLRVVGVMEPKGRILGFDMDDCAYVPVAVAMGMFNLDALHEIDVSFAHESLTDSVVRGIRSTLQERHDGKEDFTVLTQAAMLEVLDDVLRIVSSGVTTIAAISLLVGAVGILTVMWISVGERRQEIGLVRALGATVAQIRRLFLLEAVALALLGGLAGLAGGLGIAFLLRLGLPSLPLSIPIPIVAAAVLGSMATGVLSGLAPASRAAGLDPIAALRDE